MSTVQWTLTWSNWEEVHYEKAEMKRQKKARPASAGPRERRYGGGGPGKPFKPGTNAHTGAIFRRGPDRIPRGTVQSLYRALLDDDGDLAEQLLAYGPGEQLPARAALARSLLVALNDPRLAVQTAETMADRLEGRPKQVVEQQGQHMTVFYRADQPPPPELLPPTASTALPPASAALPRSEPPSPTVRLAEDFDVLPPPPRR